MTLRTKWENMTDFKYINMRKLSTLTALVFAFLLVACGPKDGFYEFDLFSTNDVHGTWFDSTYTSTRVRPSLLAVNRYVDSVRTVKGAESVILIDAGDCLQGDNAAYYFNYVDTVTPHLYPRMVDYMKYDAVCVGNHDIETGHNVYDRVRRQMKTPWLAANAVREDNGKSYFQDYVIIKRKGLKIAVIGAENANIAAWLTPELWSGMRFVPIVSMMQSKVDEVRAKHSPDIVIVATHTATGNGDGSVLEAEGLDLFKSLKGVDFLLCAHDHRPFVTVNEEHTFGFINSGSHCRNIGHGHLAIEVKDGKVVSKTVSTDLIPVKAEPVDEKMEAVFHNDYLAVKAFTLQKVGELRTELRTRDGYVGMSDYLSLVHRLGLSQPGVDLSVAAPLTFNGTVKPGTIIYNDLFTIYPYENQMFVVKMSGREVKDYLEASYDQWINTLTPVQLSKPVSDASPALLKIANRPDPRTSRERWSFENRSYNFDSAAGISYTVDVTKPFGERITISSMADGSAFDFAREYNVAMTSYRACGGGGLLRAIGIDPSGMDSRIVARFPEYRSILYSYLQRHSVLTSDELEDTSVTGIWKFVPEKQVAPFLRNDMHRLFGE